MPRGTRATPSRKDARKQPTCWHITATSTGLLSFATALYLQKSSSGGSSHRDPQPTAEEAERWQRVGALVRGKRAAEALELLERTVALQPQAAVAYQQLGKFLGKRIEGIPRDVPRAVELLRRSIALAPSAEVHATIGGLVAPSGVADTIPLARVAAHHFEAALALDTSTHDGTISCAQRLCMQRHVMLCRAGAPDVTGGAERIAAAARMGKACDAYRRFLRMLPTHPEAAAVVHYDCGERLVRATPRSSGYPALQRQRASEIAQSMLGLAAADRSLTSPLTQQEAAGAAKTFQLNGAALFSQVVPRALVERLRAELLANGTRRNAARAEAGNTHAKLRSDAVGSPDDQTLRWHRAHSPTWGAVGEAVAVVIGKLGGFLGAALQAEPSQLQLLECASIVTYPGSHEQGFHADSDRRNTCEATALVLQLALCDMDEDLGPLELVPAALGDDGELSQPPPPVAMRVRAGSVVAYNSDLVHRGGANRGDAPRPVLYLTWMARDDGLIPRQMGYTLPAEDLGRWTVQSLKQTHYPF